MRLKNLFGMLIVLSVSAQVTSAQTKEFETREQTWFGYFNQMRFTKRSGMWLDFHLRLANNFVEQTNLSIIRAGCQSYPEVKIRFSGCTEFIAGSCRLKPQCSSNCSLKIDC